MSNDPKSKAGNPKITIAASGKKSTVCHDFWIPSKYPVLSEPRKKNKVKFYSCGEDYFSQLAIDLRKAKHSILITDWVLNPDVYLIRKNGLQEKDKLINILKNAAKSGVHINILLYDSQDWFAYDLDDIKTQKILEDAHDKIRVSRSRPSTTTSPHQKTVVIDSTLAYIGGIDLAYGRWDNAEHLLFCNPKIYKGDKYNPRLDKNFDIEVSPRMPWQDVQARIEGESARDIEKNFYERWVFEKNLALDTTLRLPFLKLVPSSYNPERDTGPLLEKGTHRVQIIRTIDGRSVKFGRTYDDTDHSVESIYEAYLKAIEGAKNYIYIENQFFISNFGTNKVKNKIANAIANRIIQSIDNNEIFRVYIIIPLHPEGKMPGYKTVTNEILHWQFQTICRGKDNLLGKIKNKLAAMKSKSTVSDYINFFCLVNNDYFQRYKYEQIYIHSKLMIVDDRVIILGTANINERSLISGGDSEISGIFMDDEKKIIKFNNKDTYVRISSHDFRVKLWEQHLGKNNTGKVTDPVSNSTHNLILKVAKNNTELYEKVFLTMPSNKHPTYWHQYYLGKKSSLYPPGYIEERVLENDKSYAIKKEKGSLSEFEKKMYKRVRNITRNRNPLTSASNISDQDIQKILEVTPREFVNPELSVKETKQLLKKVEGHLMLYPLDWLKDEDLESAIIPDSATT